MRKWIIGIVILSSIFAKSCYGSRVIKEVWTDKDEVQTGAVFSPLDSTDTLGSLSREFPGAYVKYLSLKYLRGRLAPSYSVYPEVNLDSTTFFWHIPNDMGRAMVIRSESNYNAIVGLSRSTGGGIYECNIDSGGTIGFEWTFGKLATQGSIGNWVPVFPVYPDTFRTSWFNIDEHHPPWDYDPDSVYRNVPLFNIVSNNVYDAATDPAGYGGGASIFLQSAPNQKCPMFYSHTASKLNNRYGTGGWFSSADSSPALYVAKGVSIAGQPAFWVEGNATIDGNKINEGSGCKVTMDYGATGGGAGNIASNYYATVGGGLDDTASGMCATVSGGRQNVAHGEYSGVGSGWGNRASNDYATVSGGKGNTASNYASTIGGGEDNIACSLYTTISGGESNTACQDYATVGGGYANTAGHYAATVGGGEFNSASGVYSTIGGGYSDTASGDYATVSGGRENVATGEYSGIGSGYMNRVLSQWSFIAGNVYVTLNPSAVGSFAFGYNFAVDSPFVAVFDDGGYNARGFRVGINKTNPLYTLDVDGNVRGDTAFFKDYQSYSLAKFSLGLQIGGGTSIAKSVKIGSDLAFITTSDDTMYALKDSAGGGGGGATQAEIGDSIQAHLDEIRDTAKIVVVDSAVASARSSSLIGTWKGLDTTDINTRMTTRDNAVKAVIRDTAKAVSQTKGNYRYADTATYATTSGTAKAMKLYVKIGTTSADTLPTIQRAVDSLPHIIAHPCTIFVGAGNYTDTGYVFDARLGSHECGVFIHKKVVKGGYLLILGDSATPSNVYIRGRKVIDFGFCIYGGSSDIIIKGFKVDSCLIYGIGFYRGGEGYVEHCLVRSCGTTVEDGGIGARSSSLAIITNTTCRQNTANGIIAYKNSQIYVNLCASDSNSWRGIALEKTSFGEVYYSACKYNTYSGIYVRDGSSFNIDTCEISGNGLNGVYAVTNSSGVVSRCHSQTANNTGYGVKTSWISAIDVQGASTPGGTDGATYADAVKFSVCE